MLTNGLVLTGVSDIWQFIIKGLVIIGAVALDRYRLQGSARPRQDSLDALSAGRWMGALAVAGHRRRPRAGTREVAS